MSAVREGRPDEGDGSQDQKATRKKRKERKNEQKRNEVENGIPRAKEPRALVQKVDLLQTFFTNYFRLHQLLTSRPDTLLHPNLIIPTFTGVSVSVSVSGCGRP